MFIDQKQLRNEEKHFKNHETLFTIIFQKPLRLLQPNQSNRQAKYLQNSCSCMRGMFIGNISHVSYPAYLKSASKILDRRIHGLHYYYFSRCKKLSYLRTCRLMRCLLFFPSIQSFDHIIRGKEICFLIFLHFCLLQANRQTDGKKYLQNRCSYLNYSLRKSRFPINLTDGQTDRRTDIRT